MTESAAGIEKQQSPECFLTTRWSRVVLAGSTGGRDAEAALADLCRDYWRPLYYFARRGGHSAEDAEDLTQGFVAGLLESGAFARADRERGRFRNFLLGAFRNFMANHRRGQTALKRGGATALTLVTAEAEAELERTAVDHMSPERHYELTWARSLLAKVMHRLGDEFAESGRRPVFDALQPFLSGGGERPGYSRLGAQLGLSEGALTVTLHRMRRRYGVLLREEIAATVASPEEVDDELRHLMQVVSAGV